MKAIINGTIIGPKNCADACALLFDREIIGISPLSHIPPDVTIIDAKGGYIMPGLIDLHIHGYGGIDVCDGDPSTLRAMGRALLRQGVTGWLATTTTTDEATLRRAFAACRQVQGDPHTTLLGVHAEGPYINPDKAGAQDPVYAIPPCPAFIKEYADVIKILTLAPEQDPADAAIRELAEDTSIRLAMGHTTADYERALSAIAAGVTHVTHLFNAMSPLHHRQPGVVGAALTADVSCELIADNHHVHPGLYDLVWRAKQNRLCLVTDCLSAAGTEDGVGTLSGHAIHIEDQVCRLPDGTLAGSTLHLWEAVRNLYRHSHIPLWECVNCATLNPATVLGLTGKGALQSGKDADILITDTDFRPVTTILGGIVQ